MAVKLQKELKAVIAVGEENVTFTLRQPSNKELNDFLAERYEVGKRNRMKDNSTPARIEFFDKLLTGVENLVDANDQTITPAQADQIPANWKNDVIFRLFENNEIDVKN
jgi:site-specific recombinase XerC